MRKIVLLFLVVLFMTVPAMAVPPDSNVTISCTDDDVNLVTVSYASDHNRIRAFGLDITTDTNKITKVVALDPNYRIFPGQIVIVAGDVNDYKTPYDPNDLGDANVTIEMGSLYTMDYNNYDPCDPNNDSGYLMQPGLGPSPLLKFYVGGDCNYVVDVNVLRGGIVMEDPTEEPNVTLCSGKIYQPPELDLDFGDAPDSYQTTKAVNGPNHVDTGPMLGTVRDTEANGQPSAGAVLDDTTGVPDDEDGITNLTADGNVGRVTVTVSAACKLDAWMDFSNDSNFAQAGDKIFNSYVLAAANSYNLTFAIPATALSGISLYSRWRVSTAGGLSYVGAAPDGEVEDYYQLIECYTDSNSVRLAQWRKVGRPACWCASVNPRQCHGDTDGRAQGKKLDLWVSTWDAQVYRAAVGKTEAQLGCPNNHVTIVTAGGNPPVKLICSDPDHLGQGKNGDIRVSTWDSPIFRANLGVANIPGDCP